MGSWFTVSVYVQNSTQGCLLTMPINVFLLQTCQTAYSHHNSIVWACGVSGEGFLVPRPCRLQGRERERWLWRRNIHLALHALSRMAKMAHKMRCKNHSGSQGGHGNLLKVITYDRSTVGKKMLWN